MEDISDVLDVFASEEEEEAEEEAVESSLPTYALSSQSLLWMTLNDFDYIVQLQVPLLSPPRTCSPQSFTFSYSILLLHIGSVSSEYWKCSFTLPRHAFLDACLPFGFTLQRCSKPQST